MTSPGGPSGGTTSLTDCWAKRVKADTPARSAFCFAVRIAPASRSLPNNVQAGTREGAAAFIACHAAASKVASFSKAKSRLRPGLRPAAMSAASMTKVPEPHIGSTSGSSPVKPHWRRKSAARVSRSGALPMPSLCPRLCSDSPELSMLRVHRSSSMRALTMTSASSSIGAPNSCWMARAMRWAAAPE